MSESEKLKRAEYEAKRKKILYIILSGILALTMLTAVFSIIFVSLDTHTYVFFNEEGSAVYHAYLNENEYYEEERLNGDHAYVSSLIHHMDAAFCYKMQMDADDVTYQYQYRVDTQLVIADTKSGAAIYNPVETVVGPTVGTHSGKLLLINPKVDIDYVAYNDKAQEFINEYRLADVTSYLDVTMYVDVVGVSEAFAKDNEGQYSVQVRIPLNQAVLKPQTLSTIPTGVQQVLANPNTHKVVFKVLALVFGVLDGMGIAAALVYIIKTRDAFIDYTRKVQKIVNAYKSFIQKILTPFDTTGYQVLPLSTFNEMLEIRDTLQQPILMFENEDKTHTMFVIPTATNILYTFDVKVDHFDALYNVEEEVAEAEEESIEEVVEEIVEETVEEIVEQPKEEVVENTVEEPAPADSKPKIRRSIKAKKPRKKSKKKKSNKQARLEQAKLSKKRR